MGPYNGYLKQMDERMRDSMNQPLPMVYREPSEKPSKTKTREEKNEQQTGGQSGQQLAKVNSAKVPGLDRRARQGR